MVFVHKTVSTGNAEGISSLSDKDITAGSSDKLLGSPTVVLSSVDPLSSWGLVRSIAFGESSCVDSVSSPVFGKIKLGASVTSCFLHFQMVLVLVRQTCVGRYREVLPHNSKSLLSLIGSSLPIVVQQMVLVTIRV